MAGGGGNESQISLVYTPTWIVTVACALIVTITFAFERILHGLRKVRRQAAYQSSILQYLLKHEQPTPLLDALQKVKEDLNILSWISLIPVILTLAVGTKLEHVMTQLAQDVAEKHTVIQGPELVVKPSDKLFWFSRPRIMLYLIHYILFQSAFEIAFFIWIVIGSSFSKAIFDEPVQAGLLNWVKSAKNHRKSRKSVSNWIKLNKGETAGSSQS